MLKKWKFLLPVSLLATLGVAPAPQSPGLHRDGGAPATVRFYIVDSYGQPVQYKVESFRNTNKPDVELAGQFQGLTFKGAFQWQTYEFRLVPLPQARAFPAFKQRIFVEDTSTFVSFAVPETLSLPDSQTPFPETQLRIRPTPTGKGPIWASVRPAFLPQVYDPGTETAIVSPDGTLVLHGLHGGRYTVTVCQDGRILGLAVADIPLLGPSKPIEVTLR